MNNNNNETNGYRDGFNMNPVSMPSHGKRAYAEEYVRGLNAIADKHARRRVEIFDAVRKITIAEFVSQ